MTVIPRFFAPLTPFLLVAVLLALPACQSVDSAPEEEIFTAADQMPEMIGGLASIQREIKYPEVASKAGLEGRVVLQFVVNTEGVPEAIEVVKGIGGGCDAEAMRALALVRFTPGQVEGRSVPVKMTLPVTFKLS